MKAREIGKQYDTTKDILYIVLIFLASVAIAKACVVFGLV